jgi:recombination protein RecR
MIRESMSFLPTPIEALLSALSKLPGIGPRSAERIALYIVQCDTGAVQDLARALVNARERVAACENCGALTERQPCGICTDPKRDPSLLCVVERAVDIISLEKAGVFRGRYHVLGGKISPLNGVGPEDLRMAPLQTRLAKESVQEVIIALPSDVEGDATSFYLGKLLARPGVRISRIAQGLPVGSGLEFADELTLSRAMEGRRGLGC